MGSQVVFLFVLQDRLHKVLHGRLEKFCAGGGRGLLWQSPEKVVVWGPGSNIIKKITPKRVVSSSAGAGGVYPAFSGSFA